MSADLSLPAEWAPQDAILLAWPTARTDWAPWLADVQATYCALMAELSRYHRVVLLLDREVDKTALKQELLAASIDLAAIHALELPYDDTWARDFGVITLSDGERCSGVDFTFNAWGGKFESSLDNQINGRLAQLGIFSAPLQTVDMILEGGSIDSDGAGTILTTSTCLLNDNRNQVTRTDIEARFARHLKAQRVLWLEHGHLVGDDTDAHIDTLARFVSEDSIVYQGCTDTQDEQYAGLAAMKAELQLLRQGNGKPYRLIELPMPSPQVSNLDRQQRLPASYANFLLANGKLLLPQYHCAQDADALALLLQALPQFEVVGIPCRPLIEQYGSLHCITMQLPQHALNLDTLAACRLDWSRC